MSKLAVTVVAQYLCPGSSCEHHTKQAKEIVDIVKICQQNDREQEQQAALDRVVEAFAKKGTHAV